MEYRTLDLTVLSANDLKYVNHFRKMDVYVVVLIVDTSFNLKSIVAKQKSQVHKKGDKNPTWNYPVSFTLSDAAIQQNRLTVVFQVFSKRFYFPVDKRIGEVHVPVSELLSDGAGVKEARRLSYQVRKAGEAQGVLNITYKFGDKFSQVAPPTFERGPPTAYPYQPPPPPPMQQQQPPPMWGQPVSGYPPPGYGYPYQGQGQGSRYGNGYGYGGGFGAQRMGGMGMGLGAGLLGGALGGMLIGDMISDSCYDGGYDGGFDGGYDGGFDGGFDGGGFDF